MLADLHLPLRPRTDIALLNGMARVLVDDEGPFGAPTSDSARTAVSSRTTKLLVVVFCPMDRSDPHLSGALEHLSKRLTRFCSASVSAVQVVQ